MIESFLVVLREGIEAALVIGIMLVILKKTSRQDLEFSVFWGIGFAVIASLITAYILMNLPISEEAYEGVIYWTSGVFVATMMIWVHRQGKTLKRDIENRVQRTIESTTDSKNFKEVIGLGAFAFLMVFREGAETVMFLSAINLRSDPIYSAIGAVAGLGLAILFCISLIRGSLRIDLKKFLSMTSWILGIIVVQLFISGYYELVEGGVFAEIASIMAIVKPIHKSSSMITVLVVGFATLVWFGGKPSVNLDKNSLSESEYKAALEGFRRENSLRIGAIASTIAVIIALSVYYVGYKLPEITGPSYHEISENSE